MAKKYSRSQYKKERNANKDTRPKATLRNARVSTTKAAFVLDAIRGKGCTDSTWYFSIQSKICFNIN